jgi:DNA-binding transcriptional MerR regulator
VLRFWESKFSQVRPLKRGGGRRYYRPEDVAVLRRIKALLYDDGMTIRGVQKILREPVPKSGGAEAPSGFPAPQDELRRILAELTALRDDLRDALRDA